MCPTGARIPKPSSQQPVSTPDPMFSSKRLYIHLPTAQTVKLTGFRRKDRDSILGRGTNFSFHRHIDSYIRNSRAYPTGIAAPSLGKKKKSCWVTKLTTHLPLARRLRKRGALSRVPIRLICIVLNSTQGQIHSCLSAYLVSSVCILMRTLQYPPGELRNGEVQMLIAPVETVLSYFETLTQ